MSQLQDEISVTSPYVLKESKAKTKSKATTSSYATNNPKERSLASKRKLESDEAFVPTKVVKFTSDELAFIQKLKYLISCVPEENRPIESPQKKKPVQPNWLKGKTLADNPEELEVGSKVVILNSEMEIVSYGTLIDKESLVEEDEIPSATKCAVKITKSKEGSFYNVGGRFKIEMKNVLRLYHVEEETLTLEEARKAAQSSVTPSAIKPSTLVGSSSSPPSVVTTNKNVNPASKQTTQPAKPQPSNQPAKQVAHEQSIENEVLKKKLANSLKERSMLRDKVATLEKKLKDRDLEDEVKLANQSDIERLAEIGRLAVTFSNKVNKLMKSRDTITCVKWKGKAIPIDLTEEEKNALSSGKPTRAINFLLGFLEKHCQILDENENYKLTKDTSKERSTRQSITPEMQENLVAIQENCLHLAVNTNIKKLPQFITTYLDARQVKKVSRCCNDEEMVDDFEEDSDDFQ